MQHFFALGVYAGRECVDDVGRKGCPERMEGGEGAGTVCRKHYVPSFQCIDGPSVCVENSDPDIMVDVVVEKGKCAAAACGLYCSELEYEDMYEF